MKKINLKLILAAFLIFNSAFLISQTFPYGINYQGVARDANGNAKQNTQVPIQLTIIQHSTSGTNVWQERQVLTTNTMGQFNAVIGNGTPVTPFVAGGFKQLNWNADSMFLKVEINSNVSFTGVFSLIGNQKFQSVPYALAVPKKTPTVQTFTAGSGIYTTPAGVLYIEVEMVGGGGSGSGSNGSSPGAGGVGGNTTFGTSLLTANGGNGGLSITTTQEGGNGGTASLGTVSPGIALSGSSGSAGNNTGSTNASLSGGSGGTSPFGGSGGGSPNGFAGKNGITNSGSGGGGGGASASASQASGSGGGSGGYIKAIITSPSSTYSFTIGAAGLAGTAGSASSGGSGGSGIIIVKEYYQ